MVRERVGVKRGKETGGRKVVTEPALSTDGTYPSSFMEEWHYQKPTTTINFGNSLGHGGVVFRRGLIAGHRSCYILKESLDVRGASGGCWEMIWRTLAGSLFGSDMGRGHDFTSTKCTAPLRGSFEGPSSPPRAGNMRPPCASATWRGKRWRGCVPHPYALRDFQDSAILHSKGTKF